MARKRAPAKAQSDTTERTATEPGPADPVSDALTRHDAQRKADEAKLLADPVFRAAADHGERWKLAQRAAAEAAAPFRAELDKLIAEHPNGYAPESDTARRFDALKWAIQDAEMKGYAQHGFTLAIPPKSPAELLARLKRVELNWWFDLQETANLPCPSELLWQDAEGLRKRDPFLPALPTKPDAGRERYAALVRWCEDCIAHGLAALLSAFDRFYKTLDATTVPAEGGGRTVGGIAHAVALSEATNALYGELGATSLRLFQQHGQSVAAFPPGVTLMESDSPDGPWTPIPAGEVNMATMGIGGNGADAMLLAALESATKVAAFPIDKWNAMQAERPGANHQRFHAGEVVSAADLAVLESAAKLLRMKAPPATPTVSVSPDLLDRLQRAAAAVDPGAIDRAAERAAEKIARVFGGSDDNGHAKPPALPAGADAIDEHDAALLAFLNRNPSLRRKVSDVLPEKGPQDRKAVAKRLRKLADRTPPLVDYPKDERSGVVILPAGTEALKRATAPTPR